MVPQIAPYDGIPGLLGQLNQASVPVAIVTSSPDQYCKRIVAHQNWTIATVVGFHDTARRKPHPAPIDLALSRVGISADAAVSVGDRPEDTVAARAAGVFAVGAMWGSLDPVALADAEPDLICETVVDLHAFLAERFGFS